MESFLYVRRVMTRSRLYYSVIGETEDILLVARGRHETKQNINSKQHKQRKRKKKKNKYIYKNYRIQNKTNYFYYRANKTPRIQTATTTKRRRGGRRNGFSQSTRYSTAIILGDGNLINRWRRQEITAWDAKEDDVIRCDEMVPGKEEQETTVLQHTRWLVTIYATENTFHLQIIYYRTKTQHYTYLFFRNNPPD